MASKNSSTTRAQGDELPFGTIKEEPVKQKAGKEKPAKEARKPAAKSGTRAAPKKKAASGTGKKAGKKAAKKKEASPSDEAPEETSAASSTSSNGAASAPRSTKKRTRRASAAEGSDESGASADKSSGEAADEPKPRRRRRESTEAKPGAERGEAEQAGGSDDERTRRRTDSGERGADRDGDSGQRREGQGQDGQRQDGQGQDGQRQDGQRQDGQRQDGQRQGGQGQGGQRQGKRRNRRGGRRRRGRDRDRDNRESGQRENREGGRDRQAQAQGGQQQRAPQRGGQRGGQKATQIATGMFSMEKGDFGTLRREEAQWRPSKEDIYVPKRLIDREKLRDGALVQGRIGKGQKHKYQLQEVLEVDGRPPGELKNTPAFKNLTSIDPDFHYAVGDITDNVSMRIVDLLCPIGRGQRGLIVAPPRSGKTTLLREFAHGIEVGFPDVHLMVVLVDERPEEATEWRRSVERAKVFVSTADETAKNHILVAEAAWKRACRLVELGEDVVLLLDSITRLARAYNNQAGGGGRTMSGGLDSRAMERPRKIFGSARNTETAGSLTILGTTLVDTGSRLDQLVFEEFKGTGNMELVLSRRLADRRIFPAIDVERSGTRKEEKLVGMRRLKLLHTLRRVLTRMNFVEAMELLITKLIDVEKTDDFLNRFTVDPEA